MERVPPVETAIEERSTVAPQIRPNLKPRPSAELPTIGRGGREHKYLQPLVKRLAEERGFRATIEDPLDEGRSADVVLRKETLMIGCEISVTTDVEHELENLRKCAERGFSRLFFIASDKRRRDRMTKRVVELTGNVPTVVLSPEDIVIALDKFDASVKTKETTVRGYKVKVKRQSLSPHKISGTRSTVAKVIARSLSRRKKQ